MVNNICPYCKKAIPPNSSFCVNCGRDLRDYKPSEIEIKVNNDEVVEEDENKQFDKAKSKLSGLINIGILSLATICIFAFIVFYLDNKLNSTADKNSDNEEIIDNLYRNSKYKFRIKFPLDWEIKKGDGPNILVKASSAEGSSINIYVKDLGLAVGDIDELLTIEEWSESVYEKFPSAKILEQKEILIDNKKAFYVRYLINYEALDKKLDMIMFNIALTNNNFMYALTAGSAYGLFEEEEYKLNESIRTFVLEEFNGKNSINQRKETQTKKEKKVESIDEIVPSNQPWFRNSLYGVSFETPRKLEETDSKIPEGYEEIITKSKTHFLKQKGLVIFFMFIDSKFDTYDKKVGLSGSIGNMVSSLNGTDLNLEFIEPKNNLDDLKCTGTYLLNGNKVNVKGYVYWNKKGKFFILTTMGDDKDISSMNKIFDSVRISI